LIKPLKDPKKALLPKWMPFSRFFYAEQETKSPPLSKSLSTGNIRSAEAQTTGTQKDGYNK
jgi:hypothetical protein